MTNSVKEYEALIPTALQRSQSLSVIVTDMAGRYVYVNEVHRSRFCYLMDDFYGRSALETIHPDDHTICLNAIEQCIADPTVPVRAMLRKPEREGVYAVSDWEFSVLHDTQGKAIGILSIGQDITESEANARKLVAFHAKHSSVLRNMKQGFIELNTDGEVVYANEYAETLLSSTGEDMLGKPLASFVHSRTAVRFSDAVSGVLGGLVQTAIEVRSFDLRRWIRMQLHPSPEGAQVFMDDITEARISELHQMDLLELTLGQNERLRSFAHIVSHNLRSHANNIGVLLKMVVDDCPDLTQERTFEMLKSSAERLGETVDNLSTVARSASSDNEYQEGVNLLEKLNHARSVVSGDLEHLGAECRVEVPADWTVVGVSSYIESVFLNLLTNAVKYRHPDRTLSLQVSSKESDRFYMVSVTDNGLGIDLSRHEAKLFGMYKTFHNHPNAQGIGLFISKNQMEAMGGYITVESVENEGSVFTVAFRKPDRKRG